jgi:hypothetical protein
MAEKESKQKMVSFDEAGIGQFIKSPQAMHAFPRAVARYQVPFGRQAELAAIFLSEANNQHRRLTAPFIKDHEHYIPSTLKHGLNVDQSTMTAIEAEGAQEQWKREAEEFRRHVGGLLRTGSVMTRLVEKYPQIDFVIRNDLRRSIKYAKQVIDKLAALRPVSWWRNPDDDNNST